MLFKPREQYSAQIFQQMCFQKIYICTDNRRPSDVIKEAVSVSKYIALKPVDFTAKIIGCRIYDTNTLAMLQDMQ